MKLKDLITRLQDLNPEAEVHIAGHGWEDNRGNFDAWAARKVECGVVFVRPTRLATKDDLFIMLSV